MVESTDELAELEKEIRRIIQDNEKFLTRVLLDEDFPDEEDEEGEASDTGEEL